MGSISVRCSYCVDNRPRLLLGDVLQDDDDIEDEDEEGDDADDYDDDDDGSDEGISEAYSNVGRP